MSQELYNPKNLRQPDGPPYRGKQNIPLTRALFFHVWSEAPNQARYLPVFVLKHNWDSRNQFDANIEELGGRKLIEVHSTFLECDDPTGYTWAMKYLEDYEVYKRLLKYDWFSTKINQLCEEIVRRKKAKAFTRLEQILEDGNDSQALAAARYILEEGWEKSPAKRGRPSKAEVEGERKAAARLTKEEQEDADRISLVVNNTKGSG